MWYNRVMVTLIGTKNYAECIEAATERIGRGARDPDRRCFVFAEDKLTLSLERAVCEARGGGAFNVTVCTFSRYLASRAGAGAPVLSKQGAAMAVRRILAEGDLACFAASSPRAGFAPALYELVAQIKSAKVTPDELAATAGDSRGVLAGKLSDIVSVYRCYEAFLAEGGYRDENSYLSLLPAVAAADAELEGAEIFAVGFSSFTRQAEDALCALMKRAGAFTAVVPAGDNGEVYTGEAAQSVRRAAAAAGRQVREERYATRLPAEAAFLADAMFRPETLTGGVRARESDRVFVFEGADVADEAEFIARRMRAAAREGTRWREMAVLLGSPEGSGEIARALTDYGIPFFLDERSPLSDHPLSELVFGLFDTARRGNDPEGFARLAANPVVCADRVLSDCFENYLLKSGATRKSLLSPFTAPDPRKGEGKAVAGRRAELRRSAYEKVRVVIRDLLALLPRRASARAYAAAVRSLFSAVRAEERLKILGARMEKLGERAAAAVTAQAAEKWENLLCETERVLGETPLSLEEYLAVLRAGAEACEVATIPLYRDAVYVGPFGSMGESAEILFAAGMTGEVPYVKADTSILTDHDLARLADFRVSIEPTIRRVNRRQKESAALSLTAFRRQLFITYPLLGKDGKATRRSEMTECVLNMFSKGGKPIVPVNRASLEAAAKAGGPAALRYASAGYSARRPALRAFAREAEAFRRGETDDFTAPSSFYRALSEDATPEEARAGGIPVRADADALLSRANSEMAETAEGGDLLLSGGLSASALESFFRCPYRYYLEKGLRLEEREEGEVRPVDSGSVMHLVVERFVRETPLIADEGAAAARGKVIFDEVIAQPEYARYAGRAEHRNLFARMREEAGRVCAAIFRQLGNSAFRPIGEEVSFGRPGDAFPAVVLRAGERTVELSGTVDRVDEADGYVRVIDYKTGKAEDGDRLLYGGVRLQLYLYANAFTANGRYKPAGCYYFPVSDDFVKEGEQPFRWLGKTLCDPELAVKSDRTIAEGRGKGETLGLEIRAGEGETPRFARSNALLSSEQMSAFLRYAVRVSEVAAEQIGQGFIRPVAADGACDYCPYGGICRRDERGGVRVLPSVNADFIAASAEADGEKEKREGERK